MFPPIKFQDVPSFQLQRPKQETKIDTNVLSYSLPAGPRRRPNNTGFRLSVIDASAKPDTEIPSFLPPIVGSSEDHEHEEKVENENNKDMLPIAENGAGSEDQLYCRSQRYDQFPSEWQQVCWDEVQIRASPFTEYENRNNPCPKETCLKGQVGANDNKTTEDDKNTIEHESDKLETDAKWHFTRPMPGYCGHVPRFPVKPQPGLCWKRVEFLQSSALAYRLYPESEYSSHSPFAHMGPLSKTVTTTHPFNPYSKIDRWEWKPDKLISGNEQECPHLTARASDNT